MATFVDDGFVDSGFVEEDLPEIPLGYSIIPSTSLESLLSDPEANINVAVELSSSDKSDGTLKTWYIARFVDSLLLTSQPDFLPFLSGVGPLSQSLSEDSQFGGLAESSAGSISIQQDNPDNDRLSSLLDYTFAGYTAVIKLGKLLADPYEDYYTYRTFTIEQDPDFSFTETGIKLTFPLSSVLDKLSSIQLGLKRNVGIPHCLRIQTTSGIVTIPRISAYDVSRYTVSIKFAAAAVPSSIFTLSRKYISTSNCHWWIRILITGGTLGWVQVLSSSGGVLDIALSAPTNYCDGQFHTVVFSRDSNVVSYLMIDGVVIETYNPVGMPDLTASDIQTLAGSGEDVSILDHRFMDRYVPPTEAMSLFSVRTEGTETGCQGLWRFDDNGGGTGNDYSANNNDAVISGVLNTDYSWQASYLGDPEVVGRPYPYVLGMPFNALATLIDNSREIYRVGSSNPETNNRTVSLKTRGITLTQTTDYTDNADGTFTMVAPEDDPVTFDVTQSVLSTVYTLPNAISLVSSGFISVNSAQITSLISLMPWLVGYFSDADPTIQSILSELISAGAFYREDQLGQLYPDFLTSPLGLGPFNEPVLDFMGRQSPIAFGDIGDVNNSRTVTCWFKTSAIDQTPNAFASARHILIRKSDSYSLEYINSGPNAGKLYGYADFPPIFEIYSPVGLIQPDTWNFVAMVFDNTAHTANLYWSVQGGTLVSVASLSGIGMPINSNAAPLNTGFGVHGGVQHANVWNSAKTLPQLQAIMASPPIGNESGLVVCLSMNEGTGSFITEKVTGNTAAFTTSGGLPNQRWAPALTVDLNYTPSVKISNFKFLQPAWKILIQYAKNWRPMSDADISSSVSQANRLAMRSQWKEIPFEDLELRSRYPKAREVKLDTALIDQDDAEKLMKMMQTRFGERIAIAVLEFPPGELISRKACGLTIGEEIRLVSPIPEQLFTGVNMKVVAVAPDPINLSCRVIVWGEVL